MSGDDGQEAFQPFPSGLNDLVGESVGEDLPWERRDVDSGRLVFKDITERLEIRVPAAHNGVAQLEGGNIGLEKFHGTIRLLSRVN